MATEPKPAKEIADPFTGMYDWKNMGELPEGWKLPTHLDLPDSDGRPVENFSENPQGALVTQSLRALLEKRHPDKQYCIGQNSGIYWRLTENRLDGAIVPDWFYVPNVPPMLEGEFRRSYVMWHEKESPFLVLEFVSGSGQRERDDSPPADDIPQGGKFWVYERAVQAKYYGIFDSRSESLELYRLEKGRYRQISENERGHCPIPELGIELGIWDGEFENQSMPWLRLWDSEGNLLLHTEERLELERQRAEQEKQRVKAERQRARQEKQRAEAEKQRAEAEKQRAEAEKQRAEAEKQRAERQKARAERLAEQLRDLGIEPENHDE